MAEAEKEIEDVVKTERTMGASRREKFRAKGAMRNCVILLIFPLMQGCFLPHFFLQTSQKEDADSISASTTIT
jgi:hypothetical protein